MSQFEIESIESSVEEVLGEDLYWFPVRHHSPAVARNLLAAMQAVKPKIIFIEGPWEANDLIPHITASGTRPPIAIYSSFCDDNNLLGLAGHASAAEDIAPRFSSFYPVLEYSPEFVALLAADKANIPVVFMDLPHYGHLLPHEETAESEEGESPWLTTPADSDDQFMESGFYQSLAAEAGYRTWDEAWDTIFEGGSWPDHEAFRKELATFCAAARATSQPQRLEQDGTIVRERFMRQTIRETLRKKGLQPQEAMVICGGFHLFMDRHDEEPPPTLPAGTVYSTVVPYSFFRLSELSGYAAANRAPGFYQLAWELTRQDRSEHLLAEHVTEVLRRARRLGEPLAAADGIAVTQHARMLAGLRGRAIPVLDDIQDALVTCCCKGNPEQEGLHLQRAIDEVNIGNRVGRVAKSLGRLPIVDDFYQQLDALDLSEVMAREKRINFKLDTRQEAEARQSIFFHRLEYLAIPLAKITRSPETEFESGTIFQERWALRWGPKVEPALVELNVFGTTIENAVIGKLQERLAIDRGQAGRMCRHLRRSVEMDIPSLIADGETACAEAIDNDSRFVSLCEALQNLIVMQHIAKFQTLGGDIQGLIDRCFERACFSMPDISSAPEAQQELVVDSLIGLSDVLMKADGERFSKSLFCRQVKDCAEESTVPFLRGAFLGMLAELRELPPVELAAEISALALAPVEVMVTAGDFLEGVLSVSRTSIMLGAQELVAAIDELLRRADWDVFLTMIPRIRAAFERLHERQRDSVAAVVAARYGLSDEGESLTDLQTSVESAALIAEIDQQVAEVMQRWSFG